MQARSTSQCPRHVMYVMFARVGPRSLRVQGDSGMASQYRDNVRPLHLSGPILRYYDDSSKNLVTNSMVYCLS
jgi:hypothetical protein